MSQTDRRSVPLSARDAREIKALGSKLASKAANARMEVMAARSNSRAEIRLYGEIGWDVTASDVVSALKAIGDVPRLDIHIGSIGGSVFDGWVIYDEIARHPADEKVVTVDGIAASMASIIAMVGTEIVMPANSYMMIHNPAMMVMGEEDDLRRGADLLAHMRGVAVTTYATRTGQTADRVQALMNAETYLSAEEALDLGFCDRIEEPLQMAASVDLDRLESMPATMRATIRAAMPSDNSKEPKMAGKPKSEPAEPQNDPKVLPPQPNEPGPVHDPEAPQISPTPGTDKPAGTPDPKPVVEPITVNPGMSAADAVVVAEMCDKAGFAKLTAGLLKAKASIAQVQARLETARQIDEAARNVGRPAMAENLIGSGISIEYARAILHDAAASADAAIPSDPTRMQDKPALKIVSNSADIYSRLNNAKRA